MIGQFKDDLRPGYHFDCRKAEPNRLAGQPLEERLVISLDPDVSEVFQMPESVNAALKDLCNWLWTKLTF